ncbi:MAG: HEAT repeat domain-containing protein [Planctomycetota bacterium]|nr:HEAT repeat domain-containing protein [Planctomycetaceae bacterium]MDQ3332085.1 HEAT repeat domain-containing protein [Planctomycetota bacterium]
MPADPNELDRVAEVLNATFTGNGLHVDRHVDAIVNWKTLEGARKIADKITEDWSNSSSEKYIAAIKRMDMPEATNAAAEAIRRKILDDRASFRLEQNLTALERLDRPDIAISTLKILVERDSASFGNRDAIQDLVRFKTPEVAEVLAGQIGHKWVGNEAIVALKQMGETAEPVTIRLLTHRAPLVRAEAANILYDVGTQKGVDALSAAIGREKEAAVKVHLRDARKALVQKLQASGETMRPAWRRNILSGSVPWGIGRTIPRLSRSPATGYHHSLRLVLCCPCVPAVGSSQSCSRDLSFASPSR